MQHGYILAFGRRTLMDNKLAFAAALRAMRASKGMTQEMLARATSRPYVGRLEKGESTPSVEKLQALSEALGISPLTLLALMLSVQEDQPTSAVLARLKQDLTQFEKAGGPQLLQRQVADGQLVPRTTGVPMDADRLADVLRHKAAGFTQKETAVRLGISTSTVHDMWKMNDQAE
ncbi:helix-turn-helix transcriptional regulator [Pseudomonas putida]|uniref:helix-turn-helix domain-containing protein n=1 Tax=Pseudomonas putida TaxID=303 RepID=UPI00300F6186